MLMFNKQSNKLSKITGNYFPIGVNLNHSFEFEQYCLCRTLNDLIDDSASLMCACYITFILILFVLYVCVYNCKLVPLFFVRRHKLRCSIGDMCFTKCFNITFIEKIYIQINI